MPPSVPRPHAGDSAGSPRPSPPPPAPSLGAGTPDPALLEGARGGRGAASRPCSRGRTGVPARDQGRRGKRWAGRKLPHKEDSVPHMDRIKVPGGAPP